MFVGNIPRQFVLRHFMRGGLIGKLVRDRYVWTGEDNTRAFVEWRLLAKLAVSNLRVPRPAAARYCRHGLTYTADIITVRIPEVHPLSEYIALRSRDEAFWHATGASIREFHACGVYHADMNAYNLQIDSALGRLHRSLVKIKTLDPRVHFDEGNWETLLEGYFSESRSA